MPAIKLWRTAYLNFLANPKEFTRTRMKFDQIIVTDFIDLPKGLVALPDIPTHFTQGLDATKAKLRQFDHQVSGENGALFDGTPLQTFGPNAEFEDCCVHLNLTPIKWINCKAHYISVEKATKLQGFGPNAKFHGIHIAHTQFTILDQLEELPEVVDIELDLESTEELQPLVDILKLTDSSGLRFHRDTRNDSVGAIKDLQLYLRLYTATLEELAPHYHKLRELPNFLTELEKDLGSDGVKPLMHALEKRLQEVAIRKIQLTQSGQKRA